MDSLKIFDAVEEVLRMDELQLRWQRKNGWKYLDQAIAELRKYFAMRNCGDCGKVQVKKYGEPELHGRFLDQVVYCPQCGWCGVETEQRDAHAPVQLALFASGGQASVFTRSASPAAELT
ncbi:MAG: hypothetical protein C0411_24505 [Pseudomonas sp.]|nr:hypothetical protein [Pseudomonas sp.]